MPPHNEFPTLTEEQQRIENRRITRQAEFERLDTAAFANLQRIIQDLNIPRRHERLIRTNAELRLFEGNRRSPYELIQMSEEYAQDAMIQSEAFRKQVEDSCAVPLRHSLGDFRPSPDSWYFLKPEYLTNHPAFEKRTKRLLLAGDLKDINDFFVKLIRSTRQLGKFYNFIHEKIEAKRKDALEVSSRTQQQEGRAVNSDSDIGINSELNPPPQYRLQLDLARINQIRSTNNTRFSYPDHLVRHQLQSRRNQPQTGSNQFFLPSSAIWRDLNPHLCIRGRWVRPLQASKYHQLHSRFSTDEEFVLFTKTQKHDRQSRRKLRQQNYFDKQTYCQLKQLPLNLQSMDFLLSIFLLVAIICIADILKQQFL